MFNNQQPNLGGTFKTRPPRNAHPPRGMGLNFPRNRATDSCLSNSPGDHVEPDGNPTLDAKLDNISQQLDNFDAMFRKLLDGVNELSSQMAGFKVVLQALIDNMNVWTSDIKGLVRQQQAQPRKKEPQNPDCFTWSAYLIGKRKSTGKNVLSKARYVTSTIALNMLSEAIQFASAASLFPARYKRLPLGYVTIGQEAQREAAFYAATTSGLPRLISL
ncbi:hypothetical protein QBC46DRAFT_410336 [Diplogelasinospora grovesii]|uniref:Uncharacterized protein n=1 Tax=Diplogelasinospora grovesii TaxID=303347 RepID=A0AAN6N312_9PEZI|nr:hypothetical protein QBC46DRAFT_410336 [Diplogelasinospora grovesii]